MPHLRHTRRTCLRIACLLLSVSLFAALDLAADEPAASPGTSPAKPTADRTIRLGIIGLDTSHAVAFAELLNAADAPPELANCRVVAAFPEGSPDIASSVERVPGYKAKIQTLGVEIVGSIAELLERVDGVLLETNDGRPHLEQVRPVLAAKKPVFIDKPLAGSLNDALTIMQEAEKAQVPFFSSSALRFSKSAQEARRGEWGRVVGCDAFSPCSLEPTHPDLFWYGIHGVETLFTVMGPGCKSVTRVATPNGDVVTGTWHDGRIGTFRGMREGSTGYGGTVFTDQATRPLAGFDGYRPLVVEIVKFFRTGVVPIDPKETLEIYAFMEAADESKRKGGVPVLLEDVMGRE